MDPKPQPAGRPAMVPVAAAARKVSPSSTFPLPSGGFPLETHFDILRRFMGVTRNGAEPVEPAAAEGHGIEPQAAQLNVEFLCDIGLLIEEIPGRFKPTPVAMQLINTQIADEGRGRRLLRSVIDKTWFAAAARTSVRTDLTGPSRDEEITNALAAVAHIPAGQGGGSLRVLMEYLFYTGILSRSDTGPPREIGAVDPAPPRASGPRAKTSISPETTRLDSREGGAPVPSPEDADWEVIQTNEFHLKIQPKAAAVRRLRKQLDLLEQKLRESARRDPDS